MPTDGAIQIFIMTTSQTMKQTFFVYGAMVTILHEEHKTRTDPGTILATLPNVDSAFHSLGSFGKMSSRV